MKTAKIIAIIYDVEFGIIEELENDRYEMKTVHGDVLITKGGIEDDPDALLAFGVKKGEKNAQLAIYKPLEELQRIFGGA